MVTAAFLLYVVVVGCCNLPFVTKWLSNKASSLITETIGSQATINNASFVSPGSIALDDIIIKDLNGKDAIKAKRVIVGYNLSALFEGKVMINNIKMYAPNLCLYKDNAKADLNIQFIIDSLKPKGEPSKLSIELSPLNFICRDMTLQYDIRDRAYIQNKLDFNHLNISNLNINAKIEDTDDETKVRIRRCVAHIGSNNAIGRGENYFDDIELKELFSYFTIKGDDVDLKNLHLKFNESSLEMDKVHVDGLKRCPKIADVVDKIKNINMKASLKVSDFKFLCAEVSDFNNRFRIDLKGKRINNRLNVVTNIIGDGLSFTAKGKISSDGVASNVDLKLYSELLSSPFVARYINEDRYNLNVLKTINHSSKILVQKDKAVIDGTTSTNIGTICHKIKKVGDRYDIQAELKDLNLADFLVMPDFIATNEMANHINGIANVVCDKKRWEINKTELRNDFVEMKCDKMQFYGKLGDVNLIAKIIECPVNIRNGQKFVVSAMAKADIVKDKCQLTISDFNANDKTNDNISFNNISVSYIENAEKGRAYISGDVIEGYFHGDINIERFYNNLISSISRHLPSLPIKTKTVQAKGNTDMALNIKRSEVVEKLFDLPIHLNKSANITAYTSENEDKVRLSVTIPLFTVNNELYSNASLFMDSKKDSLNMIIQAVKHMDNDNVRLVLSNTAKKDKIRSDFEWKTINSKSTKGTIDVETNISKIDERTARYDINIKPSSFYIQDSVWNINSSQLSIYDNIFSVKDFMISHDNQYVSVNSLFNSKDKHKEINGVLKNIELEYIFNLLNFHPVDFAGRASGEFYTKELSKNNDINVKLIVDDFKFNNADMGTLWLNGGWADEEGKVLLDAYMRRNANDSTFIKGYVSVKDDYINLDFQSEKTSIGFLNKYFRYIFNNVTGYTTGHLHLFGPLSTINLEGKEAIHQMVMKPYINGCSYITKVDTIVFKPDTILFNDFTLYDENKHEAKVNGNVSHRALHAFKFDLGIATNHFHTLDWSHDKYQTFWGDIFTDGNMRLHGNPEEVYADINASTYGNSVLFYNSSTPGDADERDFISITNSNIKNNKIDIADNKVVEENNDDERDTSTDAYMNIDLNINPEASLVIYTNENNDDKMTLHGSGPMHIDYYNKGKFGIYGLYSVTGGQYKMTIQDIIRKTFNIQDGGSLSFNGSASDGDINLKAVYTVNSVSLSDLNIGAMNNSTANVDCILNFTGKASEPRVSFDLDFPSVNDDEKRMVKNMIVSEQDLNMQIIYLLSIGKFYTYDYATNNVGYTQDQSTYAMNSFLAGTLSGQLNDILQNALNISNWSFGTNISTGRMGWDDVEVDGMLSGKLLNNRLIVNGQFGYRDQTTYSNNFIGDFNARYALTKSGTLSLKAYSETNDRYFTKSSLTTQGGGLIFQRNFSRLGELIKSKKRNKNKNK